MRISKKFLSTYRDLKNRFVVDKLGMYISSLIFHVLVNHKYIRGMTIMDGEIFFHPQLNVMSTEAEQISMRIRRDASPFLTAIPPELKFKFKEHKLIMCSNRDVLSVVQRLFTNYALTGHYDSAYFALEIAGKLLVEDNEEEV